MAETLLPEAAEAVQDRVARLSPEARAALRARLAPPGPAAVSYQQRNFWILHQLAADPAAYNSALLVRLTGPLDVGALRAAFAAVVRGHRIYRTVYAEAADGLRATVRDDLAPALDVDDVDGGEAEALARLRADERRPFALDAEAPIRARLVRVGPEAAVLGVTFHHIANDGGALTRFWDALRRAYDAAVAGGPPPPVPEAAQYEGFAARQAARALGPAQDEALRYWRAQLRDAPPAVDVPDDGPALAPDPEPDCEVTVALGPLQPAVEALARAYATTPHVVYLAAYVAWLHRVAGARDVVVGVPIDARSRRADRDVLGCCINQLAIRQRVAPEAPFADLVRATRRAMVDGIRHADLPFLRLVEERAPEARGAFGVYDTVFQYHNFVGSLGPLGRCAAAEIPRSRPAAQFPLMLEVFPARPTPEVGLVFDAARFRRGTAERLLAQYRTLLADALAHPDRAVGELAMMDDAERRLVTEVWPVGPAAPAPATVPALFAAQARRRPEATALTWDGGAMTYGALDTASGRVAAALRARGVGPGARVGLCLERSPDLVVAMLAVLRAGAAYVPLDPETPAPRLLAMAEDAGLGAVLTDADGQTRVLDLGRTPLVVAALAAEGAGPPPPPADDPEAPAYLMYTSGSTGRPKGVVIPHRGIARLVAAPEAAALGPDDAVLHLSSPAFDAATFEIWGPLLTGGRVVLPGFALPTVRAVGAAIRAHGVTVLWLTAGLFHLVVDEGVEALRPLRRLITGGDVVSPRHVRACLDACPGLELVDGYGPTENTTFSCCYRVPPDHPAGAPVPIGRPITGSEAYVLDAALRPVPVGVEGDLWLGGDGLALGYWRRPDLTAERFVAHPFRPGATLYRSGDRARFRPDGAIEFRGRRDGQVKVRGFRVELGDVEAALGAVPAVGQGAVVARDDALVAYLVAAEGVADAVGPAREALRAALPPYLVPSAWVALDALPLTANGKVDRRALPPPRRAAAAPDAAPRTALEAELLAIWRGLFRSDAVSCADDFFALGGTSLLAVRFLAEAERRTGRDVPLTALFHHPTIRALADALAAGDGPGWTSLAPLTEGAAPPLFAVHGWGGKVFAFHELARRLAGAPPVVGVQAAEHGGGARPPTLEAAAAHYAAEIGAYQPTGTCAVIGFSMGGTVAYEVAARLRAAGRDVHLFVVDTVPVNLPRSVRLRAFAGHLRARAGHHARVVLSAPAGLPGYLCARARKLRQYVEAPPPSGPPPGGLVVPPASDYYRELVRHHVPTPADVPVTVFAATRRTVEVDLHRAWGYLAGGGLEVVTVEGDHHGLLRDDACEVIARALRERLGTAP